MFQIIQKKSQILLTTMPKIHIFFLILDKFYNNLYKKEDSHISPLISLLKIETWLGDILPISHYLS